MAVNNDNEDKVLSGVEADIIESHKLDTLEVLDSIENKLDMASGSLEFAIENSNNSGFFLAVNDHIKTAMKLLDSLRASDK